MKTNKTTATPGLRHDSHTLFQHSKVGSMFALYVLSVCSTYMYKKKCFECLQLHVAASPILIKKGKKKKLLPCILSYFIKCFIDACIIFLNCLLYRHYGKGTLLDGHKRNRSSQY